MRAIITINDNINSVNPIAESIAQKMNFCIVKANDTENINTFIDEIDAALIIVGLDNNSQIQKYLNSLREVRIPYIFVKTGQQATINTIVLPITNLLEDREKGQFAQSFSRHYNAPIVIYKPNDYGTKAEANIAAIESLLEKVDIKPSIIQGKKDSLKIEYEATLQAEKHDNPLIIISASRDYGLDDILFGPKERKNIKQSKYPIMLINPRGDLYSLCD